MLGRLWAPWRRSFVEGTEKAPPSGPSGCIFCDYPEGGVSHETYVVHVERHAFVLLNRYPYSSGHVMVVPRLHTSDVAQVPPEMWRDSAALLARTADIVRASFGSHGLNLGMNIGSAGGAGIKDHLHWHVVPRWRGDTNFMTTVGESRVIVASLEHTWQRMVEAFENEILAP